ncbi:MAG: putative rane protein [Herbinix sp.]|jgi:hypothetical protein|nr:putative rane protein [Herbinix sp.]
MKGLIIKDFINLKKNIKILGALTLLYGFMSFAQEDASFFASIFSMLFAILLLSTYSYDDMSKWESFALTMPFQREMIVRGKYYVMLLLTLSGAAFSAIFTVILNVVLKKEDLLGGIQVSAVGAAIVVLYYCILIPFITKLGVEKARYVFFAIYVIPFIIGYMINKNLQNNSLKIPEALLELGDLIMKNVYVIAPLALIAALLISYNISVNIYKKKEF